MTVKNLIKKLQKMPQNAKIAIDVSYSGKKDWTFELVELSPRFEPKVDMHPDWHQNKKGKPHNIDMVILGTIVGDNLE